ncbi:MAG: HNH endonuclease [Chloroflexota bacterium]|nr:HNH endonuclease [Chloroflexota bacterium]
MGINIVVAVTDYDWYTTLRDRPDLTEINFWSPSARGFQALREGELFLFKLHAPHNKIVGGGIFAYSNTLPSSLAWDAFGEGNGARSLLEMRERIVKYRRGQPESAREFDIGCRVLTQPFFFDESDWIAPPTSWKPNIVTYKGFDTDSEEGRRLWTAVQETIRSQRVVVQEEEPSRFGEPRVVQPRLGQGLFRVTVTDLYGRRCAVTGERTLPALDAAHIVPFSQGGTHNANNGLLLRRDVHSLFDAGYVTVTPSFQFRVSRMIEAEFRNGRSYYALDGGRIHVPDREEQRPAQDALAWHNETLYRG